MPKQYIQARLETSNLDLTIDAFPPDRWFYPENRPMFFAVGPQYLLYIMVASASICKPHDGFINPGPEVLRLAKLYEENNTLVPNVVIGIDPSQFRAYRTEHALKLQELTPQPPANMRLFRVTWLAFIDYSNTLAAKRNPPGPVVIWNLIRRCNLHQIFVRPRRCADTGITFSTSFISSPSARHSGRYLGSK